MHSRWDWLAGGAIDDFNAEFAVWMRCKGRRTKESRNCDSQEKSKRELIVQHVVSLPRLGANDAYVSSLARASGARFGGVAALILRLDEMA
jgi:hypothetical protein